MKKYFFAAGIVSSLFLLSVPTVSLAAYISGERIITIANVNARSSPEVPVSNPSSNIVSTVLVGTRGTIKDGPRSGSGRLDWYDVEYANGVRGWSAAAYFKKDTQRTSDSSMDSSLVVGEGGTRCQIFAPARVSVGQAFDISWTTSANTDGFFYRTEGNGDFISPVISPEPEPGSLLGGPNGCLNTEGTADARKCKLEGVRLTSAGTYRGLFDAKGGLANSDADDDICEVYITTHEEPEISQNSSLFQILGPTQVRVGEPFAITYRRKSDLFYSKLFSWRGWQGARVTGTAYQQTPSSNAAPREIAFFKNLALPWLYIYNIREIPCAGSDLYNCATMKNIVVTEPGTASIILSFYSGKRGLSGNFKYTVTAVGDASTSPPPPPPPPPPNTGGTTPSCAINVASTSAITKAIKERFTVSWASTNADYLVSSGWSGPIQCDDGIDPRNCKDTYLASGNVGTNASWGNIFLETPGQASVTLTPKKNDGTTGLSCTFMVTSTSGTTPPPPPPAILATRVGVNPQCPDGYFENRISGTSFALGVTHLLLPSGVTKTYCAEFKPPTAPATGDPMGVFRVSLYDESDQSYYSGGLKVQNPAGIIRGDNFVGASGGSEALFYSYIRAANIRRPEQTPRGTYIITVTGHSFSATDNARFRLGWDWQELAPPWNGVVGILSCPLGSGANWSPQFGGYYQGSGCSCAYFNAQGVVQPTVVYPAVPSSCSPVPGIAPPPPPVALRIEVGATIRISALIKPDLTLSTVGANYRIDPAGDGSCGKIDGEEQVGARGTVIAPGRNVCTTDGRVRWKVHFVNGAEGWVTQNRLEVVSPTSLAPSVSDPAIANTLDGLRRSIESLQNLIGQH
ncbi:MAG: SH3 domain-containing protein [Candidatus Ryanbacteria bacterium]|nr:SH3 domain-containing protein [Candidatus Ryanbacteria bacterium]